MPYSVIAECIDVRTGKRYLPGDTFPEPDADQAERLVKAACLLVVPAADADELDRLTKAELEALAADRGIDARGQTKAKIIEALKVAS